MKKNLADAIHSERLKERYMLQYIEADRGCQENVKSQQLDKLQHLENEKAVIIMFRR